MFEFDEEIIEGLLKENTEFKKLYDEYANLRQEVSSINSGDTTVEDMKLEEMKKEKLFLKDQIAKMIEVYKRNYAA